MKLNKIKKCSLVVIRLNKDNQLIMSKPCQNCIRQMLSIGLKTVIYSNDDGKLIEEKLENMQGITTSGFKGLLWKGNIVSFSSRRY